MESHSGEKKLGKTLIVVFTCIISFVLAFLTIIYTIFSNQYLPVLCILLLGLTLTISIFFFIKKEKYRTAKFFLSTIPPNIIFIASLVTKSHGIFSNVYTYLTPRMLMILYVLVPVVFFGLRKKKDLLISLIILSPSVLFFEFSHSIVGVHIKDLEFIYEFHFIFVAMTSLFITVLFLSILSFQKTSILYRHKLNKQNLELQNEKEEITSLNDKLKFQANLYKILEIVSKKKVLAIMLQDVLDEFLSIDCLNIQNKGLIFLTNSEGNLEITAQRNVQALNATCSVIKKGQCLCGEVLESKQKIFCNIVGHNHTIVPKGMTPHGHYVIPILDKDVVLGVINIYIKQGEKRDLDIEEFLEAVAIILSRRIILHNANEKLKSNNILLKQQTKIVNETLNELHQSIEYAEFLQKSLIPNSETINTFFDESSVLFLPKDKVSGDFYFAHDMGDNLYFGVGDCTGHGIPGGFLAAMSIEAVKTTIQNLVDAKPNVILEELRIVAKERFSINFGDKRSDSMDAALCMYNKDKDELYYSGGFMNLKIIRNNTELIEFKATKCPIGSYPIEPMFELNKITLQKGDVIYITSDGYVDQFGMIKGKEKPTKFKRKQYRELILKNVHLPCEEQVEILKKTLSNWRGDIEQIDDVTVFIARH